MSNRKTRRISVEPPNNQDFEIPKSPQSVPQNFNGDISLQLPTDMVQLPSQGAFYDESSSLFGKTEIEIKQLTAKEEDILSSEEYLKKGVALDKLLESIILDKTINPKDFLVGDKNAILLSARVTAYGSEYNVTSWCDYCNAEAGFAFDLSQCSLIEEPEEIEGVTIKDGIYRFDLPKSGVNIGIRLLTVGDTEYLKKQDEMKQKTGLESTKLIDFLQRIIVDAGGNKGEILNKFIQVLPALDVKKIRSVYNKVNPDINVKQEVSCSSCSQEFVKEVWFDLNFFWPEF